MRPSRTPEAGVLAGPGSKRLSLRVAAALAAWVWPQTAGFAAEAEPRPDCRVLARTADRLAAADGGELTLASGRRATLVDVRLAPPSHDGGAGEASLPPGRDALAVLRSFVGSGVSLEAVGSEDRWGRVPARIGLAEVGEPIDLAELLVGGGLAMVDAGERDALCRPGLLALETKARAARHGIWAVAGAVLPAGEPDALRERAGRFALVEGRIASVGERRERTYLNFGRDFSRDFAVVLPRKTWAALKAAGRTATSLRGARIRVRGTLELRRAPSMEVTAADMLEVAPMGDEQP